jgi:chromosome segregation ATPase
MELEQIKNEIENLKSLINSKVSTLPLYSGEAKQSVHNEIEILQDHLDELENTLVNFDESEERVMPDEEQVTTKPAKIKPTKAPAKKVAKKK